MPGAHIHVRHGARSGRLAGPPPDLEPMLRAEGQPLVEIGAQPQLLSHAGPSRDELHRDEGHVVDLDPAPLRRRDQPIAAVGLAPQHRGEQLTSSLRSIGEL